MTVGVLIVHQRLLYAQAFRSIVDAEDDLVTVGVATSIAGALAQLEVRQPEALLLDLDLGWTGVTRLERVGVRVVAMTSEVTVGTLDRAIELGAMALVGEDAPVSELLSGLRDEGAGITVVGATRELPGGDAEGWRQPADRASPTGQRVHLTDREREVLWYLRAGHDAAHIAEDLGVSIHTSRSHIKRILAKLGAHSQLEAVASANRLGLRALPDHGSGRLRSR